jgi:predicted DCC family thiol-disulfide oxidoreductase YuxK
MDSSLQDSSIVLFDGACNFCNRSVQFIIRHDPAERFIFVPMQSTLGEQLAAQCSMDASTGGTMILIENDTCYVRSDAALRIAAGLSGRWPLLRYLKVVPRPLRDGIYRFVARNRYRWFGRRSECFRPDDAVKNRFRG